jgi:hypothetical protein
MISTFSLVHFNAITKRYHKILVLILQTLTNKEKLIIIRENSSLMQSQIFYVQHNYVLRIQFLIKVYKTFLINFIF